MSLEQICTLHAWDALSDYVIVTQWVPNTWLNISHVWPNKYALHEFYIRLLVCSLVDTSHLSSGTMLEAVQKRLRCWIDTAIQFWLPEGSQFCCQKQRWCLLAWQQLYILKHCVTHYTITVIYTQWLTDCLKKIVCYVSKASLSQYITSTAHIVTIIVSSPYIHLPTAMIITQVDQTCRQIFLFKRINSFECSPSVVCRRIGVNWTW